MLTSMKKEMNLTLTENGAVTYSSTGSDCLDFFATSGSLRNQDADEIIRKFVRAFAENPDWALKLLFYTRDVRGGLGERRTFRVILQWLAFNEPDSVRKNITLIPQYGRFDDLLTLLGTPCEEDAVSFLKHQLEVDLKALKSNDEISLLGKWMPSINASSQKTVTQAKRLAKAFDISEETYRKNLTALRRRLRIVENNLRTRDYSFDYEKQPSRALYKYRAAFMRNDYERYSAFINATISGKKHLHADHIAPYELVEPYLTAHFRGKCFMRDISKEEKSVLNATWNALPNYCGRENALAIVDTSGSMYMNVHPLPAAVALSLGIYLAEHNRGYFRDHFIEFSEHPQLIELKGETFVDRLRYAASFNEIGNTNLEAVFDLLLQTAVKNHVEQDELPATLVIISDMEFDVCITDADSTIFENARQQFAENGYQLPKIVFWNAASRHRNQPVTMNEQGVVLVSGVTPRLFSMLASGTFSPLTFMMEVLDSDRYKQIAA